MASRPAVLSYRRDRGWELASDRRAGWYARTDVRRRHRAELRSQWRTLTLFGAAMVALFTVASLFVPGQRQQGFLLGMGVTFTACTITALVVLTAGTAPLMMGELAEQWTAQELRPLSAHGWRLVNHFGLGYGDSDHVVVGPGGIVVVETKWGGTPWDVEGRDPALRRALRQAADNARQLARWHGVAQHGRPQVEAVLVVWGPAGRLLRTLPPRRHESGVVVLSGKQLEGWMLGRGRDRLSPAQVDGVWQEIDRHVVRRDKHERATRPMPRSLAELGWTVLGCVALALAGFLLSAHLLTLLHSVGTWTAVGLSVGLVAGLLGRHGWWRWYARAFAAGVLATQLLTAVVMVRAAVLGT